MIVLKIIGFILLGILALILLALCLKIRIEAEYSSENTSVVLKCLFLSIPIYPKKKKANADDKEESKKDKKKKRSSKEDSAKEPKTDPETIPSDSTAEDDIDLPEENGKDEKTESTTEEKTKTESKTGVKELLETVYNAEGVDGLLLITKRTFNYLGTFFGALLRWIVVNEFYLDVRCTKSDAASTAIYYGEVCSSLFPMLGSLVAKCRVKKYDINVYPDYMARFSSAQFIIKFYFIPIVLAGHALALVLKLVFKVALQLVVKIFLYLKGNKKTGNENKNSKGKSGVTNE